LTDLIVDEHGSNVVIKLLDSQYIEVTILILSIVGADVLHLSKHIYGNLVVQKCLTVVLSQKLTGNKEVMQEVINMITHVSCAVETLATDK